MPRLLNPDKLGEDLLRGMSRSFFYVEDDFVEDTLSTTRWNVTKDTNATNFAWTAGQNGVIAGTTSTDDNSYLAINGDLILSGDLNCGMEVRCKISAVTGFTFEIGLTDALADETLPAVSDVDTPATSNGAAETAVLHLDTDQTLATAAFVTEGSGGLTVLKTNAGTWVPTADTYFTVRVFMNGNIAYCKIYNDKNRLINSSVTGQHTKGYLGGGLHRLEGGTAIRPHVLFGSRNTTDKTVTIDYIRYWQDRYAE